MTSGVNSSTTVRAWPAVEARPHVVAPRPQRDRHRPSQAQVVLDHEHRGHWSVLLPFAVAGFGSGRIDGLIQRDGHRQSAALRRRRGERSAHGLGEPASYGQPESQATVGIEVTLVLERGEDAFVGVGGHAGALVDDLDV